MHSQYDVKNNSDDMVHLDFSLLFAQKSKTRLYLNGIKLSSVEDTFSLDIGKNKDLKGKSLSIYSIVKDVNPDINNIGITITLSGGEKNYVYPPFINQVVPGGISYFHLVIYFY